MTAAASLGDDAPQAHTLGQRLDDQAAERGHQLGGGCELVELLGAGLVAHLYDGRTFAPAINGEGSDGTALLLRELGTDEQRAVGGDGEAGHGSVSVDLRESYHGGGVGVNPPRRAQTGVERSVAQKARRAVLALRRRGSMVGFGPVWRPLKKAAL